MADYGNIQRVIIRKPIGIKEAYEAFQILQELNSQIGVVKRMAERQVLPEIVIQNMMQIIDIKIDKAVHLAGFANAEDMKYWIENFKDL